MEENKFKPFLLGVYGTLKRDFGNHVIIKDCKFIGNTITNPEFTMYSISYFPGIIHKGDTPINLEVYYIEDEQTAQRLDRLEGYPELYDKEFIQTEFGDTLIYIFNRNIDRYKIIQTGNW